MIISSTPSVLVVRSTCLSDSQEESAQQHAKTLSDTDTTTAMTTMLQQTLQSLPVTCDIVIIPEVPVYSEIRTNEKERRHGNDEMTTSMQQRHNDVLSLTSMQNDIRMDRQALHPCGMDNVLILRNLPPAADSAGYLLGLSSCEMIVSHIDTPSGNMMELPRPFQVSVQAAPSTFSFSFNDKDSSHASSNHGVVVNPRSASAELQVVFDFGDAVERLESVLQKQYQDVRTTSIVVDDNDDASLKDNDETVVMTTEEETHTTCGPTWNDNVEMMSRNNVPPPSRHNDELLHVLRELAENEAQHLDYMLVALGLVFCLLLVHYARTVMPLIRGSKQVASTKSRRSVRLSSIAEQTKGGGTRGKFTDVPRVCVTIVHVCKEQQCLTLCRTCIETQTIVLPSIASLFNAPCPTILQCWHKNNSLRFLPTME